MSKRKLDIDDNDKVLKSARGDLEPDFSKMPVSSALLNIQSYDVVLDMVLYLDSPTSMRENIKSLYSFYKQISSRSVANALIKSIQEGRDDADYIGYNLALLAEMGDDGDTIKQVIAGITDITLKAKSLGSALYRLAKAESDEATIKRTLDVIEDQSLKTNSIAIGLYLLFKDQEQMAIVGHLLSAIEDQSFITQVVNTSLYWMQQDMSVVSKLGEVVPDSNVAQTAIVADDEASGLVGESSSI